MILFALFLVSSDTYRPPEYTAKFANGCVIEYGEQKLATVRTKCGTVALDLDGFLKMRIAGRIRGDPDKTANNLEYQYNRHWLGVKLFQAVPISREEAIAIIGYPAGDKGSREEAQDLVSISVRAVPTIRLIRTLPLPKYRTSSDLKPHLFWSQKKLLLRNASGFEIIDTKGRKAGELPQQHGGYFVGVNSRRELIYVNTRNCLSVEFFNPTTRNWRIKEIVTPYAHVSLESCFFLGANKMQLELEAYNFETIGGRSVMKQGAKAHYILDTTNGRQLGKPLTYDGNGHWHN